MLKRHQLPKRHAKEERPQKFPKTRNERDFAVYNIVQIIQTKKIQSRLQLMALASKWQEEGKTDLTEFVANRGPKIVNEAIETAKELTEAQARLQRSNKTRIELLAENVASACIDGCNGIGYQLPRKYYSQIK